jgi:hypothetical protein
VRQTYQCRAKTGKKNAEGIIGKNGVEFIPKQGTISEDWGHDSYSGRTVTIGDVHVFFQEGGAIVEMMKRLLSSARHGKGFFAMTSLVSFRFLGMVFLFSAFFPLPALAEDSEMSRATLAGLQCVNVVVEEVQPNVQKYAAKFGLSSAQIRQDVVKMLRDGGIRVIEGSEWLAIPGRPFLYVNINTHETEKFWYAYNIKLELRQLAILEANPQVKTLAGTWSLNITGQANIGNLNLIRKDVVALAARFVGAYKMNNK